MSCKDGEAKQASHITAITLTMVEDEKVDHFLEILHDLDKETEAQGLRAFVWNIEKTI